MIHAHFTVLLATGMTLETGVEYEDADAVAAAMAKFASEGFPYPDRGKSISFYPAHQVCRVTARVDEDSDLLAEILMDGIPDNCG